MTRLFHSWRDSNAVRHYPFTDLGPPTAGDRELNTNVILDANIHPPDAPGNYYLSRLSVDNNSDVLFEIGSVNTANAATGIWSQTLPDLSVVPLYSTVGDLPAGVLVVDPLQMSFLQASLKDAEMRFDPRTAAFVASTWNFVNSPPVSRQQPGVPVAVSDDLYLVGERGVRLSVSNTSPPVVYVHAVGDPLARLRDCIDEDTPRFVREVVFQHGEKTIACKPNDQGEVFIAVVGRDGKDSSLRMYTQPNEIKIGFSS